MSSKNLPNIICFPDGSYTCLFTITPSTEPYSLRVSELGGLSIYVNTVSLVRLQSDHFPDHLLINLYHVTNKSNRHGMHNNIIDIPIKSGVGDLYFEMSSIISPIKVTLFGVENH